MSCHRRPPASLALQALAALPPAGSVGAAFHAARRGFDAEHGAPRSLTPAQTAQLLAVEQAALAATLTDLVRTTRLPAAAEEQVRHAAATIRDPRTVRALRERANGGPARCGECGAIQPPAPAHGRRPPCRHGRPPASDPTAPAGGLAPAAQVAQTLLTAPDRATQDAGAHFAQAAILEEVTANPGHIGPVEAHVNRLQGDPQHGATVRAALDRNGWPHCGSCGRFIGRPAHQCPQAGRRTPAQALEDLAPQQRAAQAGWDQAVGALATAPADPTTPPAQIVALRQAVAGARRLTWACESLRAHYQAQLPPAPPPPPPDPVHSALEVLLPQLAQRPARHALIGALGQPDPAVRRLAAAALAGWSDDGVVQTALIAAARDPDPAVRRWALTGLVSPLAASDHAARMLGAATTDPDPTVRATVPPTPRGTHGDGAVTRRLAQATVGALPGLADLGAGRASDPATLTGLGRAAAALAGHPEVAPELRAVAAQWAVDPPAGLPWSPTAVKLARRLLGLSGVASCPQCGGWATPEHTCVPVSAAGWGAIQTAGATLAPSPSGAAAPRPSRPPPAAPPDSPLPAPRDPGSARPLAPTGADPATVTSRQGIIYADAPGLGLTNPRYRRTAVVEAAIRALPPLDDPGFVPAALAAAQQVQQPEPLIYAAQALSRAGRREAARPLGDAIATAAAPILLGQARSWGLSAEETADLVGHFNLRFWERICRPGPTDEFLSVHFRADVQGDLRDWYRQRGRHAAHERRFGVWDDGEGGTLREEDTLPAAADVEAEVLDSAAVGSLLAGLPEGERRAFVLHHVLGLPAATHAGHPGVAATLGISRRSVTNYLQRARQRLGPAAVTYLEATGQTLRELR